MVLLVLVQLQIGYLQEFCFIFIIIDFLALPYHEVRVADKDELITISVGVVYYLFFFYVESCALAEFILTFVGAVPCWVEIDA